MLKTKRKINFPFSFLPFYFFTFRSADISKNKLRFFGAKRRKITFCGAKRRRNAKFKRFTPVSRKNPRFWAILRDPNFGP